MTKHTPGPWAAYSSPQRGYWYIDQGPEVDQPDIACVMSGEVDARLIAAAPEMLEYLKDLADCLTDYIRYGQEMRKHGRGFSTVDTAGRVDANVLAGARALLARVEGKE